MSLSYVKHRIALERRIVGMIIADAIAQGFSVSVFDGEDRTLIQSTDEKAILAATMTTDEDALTFHDRIGNKVGTVWLVYGNDGFDVMADHTDNKETRAIIRRAEAYAESAEAEEIYI